MRLIGLAVVLTVSLILAPLTAEGQQAEKMYRVGLLSPTTQVSVSKPFGGVCGPWATLKVAISFSSSAQQRGDLIGCLN